MSYPPGAGPGAGAFSGEPWTPDQRPPGASVTSSPPAPLAGPGPTAYTRRLPVVTYVTPPVPGPGGIARFNYAWLGNPSPNRTLLVRRLTLFCPELPTRCYVLLTALSEKEWGRTTGLSLAGAQVLSSTPSGDYDENEAVPPYAIPPGQNMALYWDLVQAGRQVTTGTNEVHTEYDEA